MARFYGTIGFEQGQTEVEPGVFLPSSYEERNYYGTMMRHQRRWENNQNGSTNDDMILGNQLSIVADMYLKEHWPAAKYVTIAGTRWKVNSVEIKRPRLILNLGGVWNGNTA